MKNFDWSKVTTVQLSNVPRAVIGEFTLDINDGYLTLVFSDNYAKAELGRRRTDRGWYLYGTSDSDVRETIACIDRIANYLTIHGGE